jgi:hypothetical protein
MAIDTSLIRFLNAGHEKLLISEKAQVYVASTDCALVLLDTFQMFKQTTKADYKALFCETSFGQQMFLKLGYAELVAFVMQCLELNEDFVELEYLKYIVRKIFARYQVEGKIKIEISYN